MISNTALYSAEMEGLESRIIKVEVNMKKGLPRFIIVGLAAINVKEATERVRIGIENSGFNFPMKNILVNLSPAGMKKDSSWFDLSIAVAILRLSGELEVPEYMDDILFLGELGLDGSIKPMRGLANILFSKAGKNFKKVIVPIENEYEAAISPNHEIYPIRNLLDIPTLFRGEIKPVLHKNNVSPTEKMSVDNIEIYKDQALAMRAITVAVAGKHHLLFSGSPGAGKTMLARLAHKIQPDLTMEEYEEVLRIKSSTEILNNKESILLGRPFRSPHHTSSDVSLIGGGKFLKVGEVTLAHNGILFLDELCEFKSTVIQSLREPLEEKKITISRVNYHLTYPSNFLLIAATNPCPCGYLNHISIPCICPDDRVRKYQSKLSGPFLDRIDIFCELEPKESELGRKILINLSEIRKNINAAVRTQQNRYKEYQYSFNGEVEGVDLDRFFLLEKSGESLWTALSENYRFSIRKLNKIKKLSRTLADLDNSELIKDIHIYEAIQLNKREKLAIGTIAG